MSAYSSRRRAIRAGFDVFFVFLLAGSTACAAVVLPLDPLSSGMPAMPTEDCRHWALANTGVLGALLPLAAVLAVMLGWVAGRVDRVPELPVVARWLGLAALAGFVGLWWQTSEVRGACISARSDVVESAFSSGSGPALVRAALWADGAYQPETAVSASELSLAAALVTELRDQLMSDPSRVYSDTLAPLASPAPVLSDDETFAMGCLLFEGHVGCAEPESRTVADAVEGRPGGTREGRRGPDGTPEPDGSSADRTELPALTDGHERGDADDTSAQAEGGGGGAALVVSEPRSSGGAARGGGVGGSSDTGSAGSRQGAGSEGDESTSDSSAGHGGARPGTAADGPPQVEIPAEAMAGCAIAAAAYGLPPQACQVVAELLTSLLGSLFPDDVETINRILRLGVGFMNDPFGTAGRELIRFLQQRGDLSEDDARAWNTVFDAVSLASGRLPPEVREAVAPAVAAMAQSVDTQRESADEANALLEHFGEHLGTQDAAVRFAATDGDPQQRFQALIESFSRAYVERYGAAAFGEEPVVASLLGSLAESQDIYGYLARGAVTDDPTTILRGAASRAVSPAARLFLQERHSTQALHDLRGAFRSLGPAPLEELGGATRGPASVSAHSMAESIEAFIRQEEPELFVTGTYREPCIAPNNPPTCSDAHARGAIDIRGIDETRAQRISQRLGPTFLVIIEEVLPGGRQRNIYYRGGRRSRPEGRPNPEETRQSARGSHTHVQPDPGASPPVRAALP